ncbi:Odorant receptor 021 [Nylanderia fulva]|uniref:Odorant receptor n=1 Tax=Nylanderia fulva TaxID=613905 RepID=A0A6G1LQK6_9HYME|nr:putative odorant receptor 85d [Nylanderia fulva]KAF3054555.1 Odorant receptor 021 [Nylanderia fulva]
MRVMQFPLKVLTVAGCWPPVSWSLLCKQTVYNAYTIFICLLLLTFALPQIMDIILNVKTPDEFSDSLYTMLPTGIACCKILNLLINRKNIKILTDALIEEPFKPLESDEIEIRQKFDNTIQTYAICYTILIELTCGCMNLSSFFTDFRKGTLAYREWVPYEYSTNIMYYVIYFRQLISLQAASIVNVACDCLICALLLHIYCQIKILECRLKKCLRNQGNLGECVHQHNHIFKFARVVNENFRFIIGIQFTVSMLVVCSSLFLLAKTTLSAAYIPLILYTFCMALQILIYCWYGNEVRLKSIQLSQEIFGMDWINTDKKMKDGLIIIMNRSLIPIEFSCAYILTVNLDSFVKLMKTSYSAYNILQHM